MAGPAMLRIRRVSVRFYSGEGNLMPCVLYSLTITDRSLLLRVGSYL